MNDEILTRRAEDIHDLLSGLAGLQDCACYVLSYQSGHHQLTLAVLENSPEPSFYLHFEPTFYFEGPTNWTGVDFRLATQDEWKEVLLKTPLKISGDFEDEVIKHHFLFVLKKPDCQVKILSATCYKVKKAHRIFLSYADSL
jgi:hypothetical protein